MNLERFLTIFLTVFIVKRFSDRLIAYYKSLDGKTYPVLTAYHIEQIAK